jgi:hypothetical protein
MLRDIAKWTMYLGMAISMVSGATWPRPTWGGVLVGLVVVSIGIVLKRKAGTPPLEELGGAEPSGNRPPRKGTLVEALQEVAAEIEVLSKSAETVDLVDIKKRVEELNWLGAERLGQAQETVAAMVGFATYAEVMAPLATAERLLNRAWSAAADGHRPEAVASLAAALPYAQEAAELAKSRLART